MPTLDQVLNFLVPLGIFVFLAAAVSSKMREPLSQFFSWIKDLLGWGVDKVSDMPAPMPTQIVYR